MDRVEASGHGTNTWGARESRYRPHGYAPGTIRGSHALQVYPGGVRDELTRGPLSEAPPGRTGGGKGFGTASHPSCSGSAARRQAPRLAMESHGPVECITMTTGNRKVLDPALWRRMGMATGYEYIRNAKKNQ
ncbi:hypothetical protein MIND_01150200 [Mycena indigotica]|uniref:Uncharacterized protein n=1 Tax=Mycena indigotica TaxID=2126181 RepID=A0A8H6VVR6_9AGAR|nr:uncharacterized protein MIND_01150200 [Mycena indigotica]KAF7293701.1 hypothetical protein MIND_01150200 [Mycena indigotica]